MEKRERNEENGNELASEGSRGYTTSWEIAGSILDEILFLIDLIRPTELWP
jgi:hypothetical protein